MHKYRMDLALQFHTDVLIIGAGPTGSVLVLDLTRRGVNERIIDGAAQSFPG